jgi:hypothetical protein
MHRVTLEIMEIRKGEHKKTSGEPNKMFYEGTIKLERGDREVLLADLQAIEDLLQSRRAARIIERAESIIQEAA